MLNNKDGNYLVEEMADRMDRFHRKEIQELLQKLNVQLVYQIDRYLFSHSGVLPTWLETNDLKLEELNELPLFHPALQQVSPNRGGWNECGSCIWGDVREYADSTKIPNIYQIFGHTQLVEKPIITPDFACLDCRKAFILDTETGDLKEYE